MAEENTTILILKGVKKVRSIKINRKRIRLAIYAASIFSIVLVFSIGLNVYQYINPGFSGDLTGGIPVENNTPSSQIADHTISSPDESTESLNGLNGQANVETDTVEEKKDIYAGDIDSKTIGLDNLRQNISRGTRELDVSFGLFIKGNSDSAVSGTYIILAKTDDRDNPYISSNPEVRIDSDGTVPNYFRGDYFSMSIRTPPKTGRLVLPDNSTSFEYYRILVFSNTGDILLQQTRPLNSTF